MGVAKLKVLEMEVSTGWFTRFHDDGFVDDLDEHIAILNKRYKGANTSSRSENAAGCCVLCKRAIGIFYPVFPIALLINDIHICYLDKKDDILNMRVRAHEEAHALDHIGKFSLLENALSEITHEIPDKLWNYYFGDFNPNLSCSRKEANEGRARMGELYAIHKYYSGLKESDSLAAANSK